MAPARLWRVVVSRSPEWRETFLRLAAETPEGRTLAPTFHGNILSFDSLGKSGSALRLVKDLMVQASFAVEHQACGEAQDLRWRYSGFDDVFVRRRNRSEAHWLKA